MGRELRISPDLSLPKSAVTETFGLLAVRGAGKTNAARVMAEQMFKAGLPFVAVDPVGSWRGLRSSRNGRGPGIPVPIFGGKWGDVPLERTGGSLIADLVVDQGLSCVLDVSSMDSEAAKKQFLLDFARRLYQRNEHPLHLFLEEADDYIPQKPMRDEALLLRAWENIVRRGRARGIGCTIITQRSASVAKSVLTQVQTLIAMRTTGPQDIKAISDWLLYYAQRDTALASLSSLKAGEAWVWSPVLLGDTVKIRFALSETFDSGATPKAGARPRGATLADVDLGKLKTAMADTIKRAEESNPELLRQQVRKLRAELEHSQSQHAKMTVYAEQVEHKLKKRGGNADKAEERRAKAAAKGFERLDACLKRIVPIIDKAETIHLGLVSFKGLGERYKSATITFPNFTPVKLPTKAELKTHREKKILGSGYVESGMKPRDFSNGLSAREQRVLNAISWWARAGQTTPDKIRVGFMSGYRVGREASGTFGNILGKLRTLGLIDYPSPGLVSLTDAGEKQAGDLAAPLTPESLVREVSSRLDARENRVLRAIMAAHPKALSKQEAGAESGYQVGPEAGGTFGNILGRLRSLGLIEYPQRGAVRAADMLFTL